MKPPVQGEIVSRDILDLLPHRYPFLLVDRVLEFVPFTFIKAVKNITLNEPHFQGHFPMYPVMPGVLILEAMAQTGGIMVIKSIKDEMAGKIFLFAGLDKVRFRRPVFPGDQLIIQVDYGRHKNNLWKMHATSYVDGATAAQGLFSAAIVDREDQ
ncbi:MAG: 3-hydroxyacyl-ACP dehydratase FabZ [Desulfonatronovibrionaceae bacterium]